MFNLERVEAFFDEVDEYAWSDRGVEAGEVWVVASAVLGLRLGVFGCGDERPSETKKERYLRIGGVIA